MGEGGALLIRDEKYVEEAEILREKGTNRSKFYRGQIDKYTWVNFGSSYLPSDMNAAYLYAQLEIADEINQARLALWDRYYERLEPLGEQGRLELPRVPESCIHNAHMFYVKAGDIEERTRLIDWLKENGILSVFHYIPLHTAPRKGLWALPRRGQIYHQRKREAAEASYVLWVDCGAGG